MGKKLHYGMWKSQITENRVFLLTWPAVMQIYRNKRIFFTWGETPTRLVWNTNMADMTSCHDGPPHLTKQEPTGFWMNLMIGRKTNRFLLINSGFVITCEVPSQNQACLLRRKKSRSSLFANETRKARYFSRKNLHDVIVFECCWKVKVGDS